ncbi:MAG TPA: hypothetical protein VF179_04755 [Thermoanaerobaculia bacterium]|nr:hypothetical protein [Thermoanaerobaculia bacterium]
MILIRGGAADSDITDPTAEFANWLLLAQDQNPIQLPAAPQLVQEVWIS